MIIDITESSFMEVSVDESNAWMSKHVGKLIHDAPERSTGEGWVVMFEPDTGSWVMKIDDDAKAAFFLLRWL
jgi:hypothetical protein